MTEKEPTPFSHFPQRGSPCHGSAVAKVLPKSHDPRRLKSSHSGCDFLMTEKESTPFWPFYVVSPKFQLILAKNKRERALIALSTLSLVCIRY